MTKKIACFIFSLIFISTIFISCNKNQRDKKDQIKIGAILPLTGELGHVGASSKNALDMLVKETNEKGGIKGREIKIIYKDDQNDFNKSVDALEELIEDEKDIIAVIGGITSKCSLAMDPIACKNKVPIISPLSTSSKFIEEGCNYVHRACFNNDFQTSALSEYIFNDLNASTASIIYNSKDEYSKELAEMFKNNFKKVGGRVLLYEDYSTSKRDVDEQLSLIKNSNSDVIFLPDYYNNVSKIVDGIEKEKIKPLVIGSDSWDLASFVKNSIFINHYSFQNANPKLIEFKKKYEDKYAETPNSASILSYDSLSILLDSIEKAENIDGDNINNEIKKSEADLISGEIKYDINGNLIKDAVIIKVENNKKEFIKKVSP